MYAAGAEKYKIEFTYTQAQLVVAPRRTEAIVVDNN